MAQHRFLPNPGELDAQRLANIQLAGLKWTVDHAFQGSPVYRERLRAAGFSPGAVTSLDDLRNLPTTSVEDLRQGYPLPLVSVPETEIVRLHASSGTTGKRKILAYTQKDVDDWKDMMARCFEMAGLTTADRAQIAVGYGLWTAGAGFQLGCERFGAMAVPIGPGNLEMQVQLLVDVKTTCLCSTASMALLLAEEVEKQGLGDQIALKTCIFGAEAHTPKMRERFEKSLNLVSSHDITGMTELYGPGAGLECREKTGVHYWADYYILEVVNPETLAPVAPGEIGEMLVTTLRKEAAPLIRYRTRDLTRLIPGECPCGVPLPRHDHILGRSDDMFIIRGVNVYPGQIAEALSRFTELGSEYQIVLRRQDGLDTMRLRVERAAGSSRDNDEALGKVLAEALRKALQVSASVRVLDPGELPRSFGKSKRVLDERAE